MCIRDSRDFTVDPYQIYEAKLMGADAVLLICALLPTEKLKMCIRDRCTGIKRENESIRRGNVCGAVHRLP